MKVKRNRTKTGDKAVTQKVMLYDELCEFEEFRQEILPALRADIRLGKSPKELREKYLALMTARQISIGLTNENAAVALTAIKDLQDRAEGKAVEKKVVTHQYAELKDNELDAMLLSEVDDLNYLVPEKSAPNAIN